MKLVKSTKTLHSRLLRFTIINENKFELFQAILVDDKNRQHISHFTRFSDYFKWIFYFKAMKNYVKSLIVVDDEGYVIANRLYAAEPGKDKENIILTYSLYYDIIELLRARRNKTFLVNGMEFSIHYHCEKLDGIIISDQKKP